MAVATATERRHPRCSCRRTRASSTDTTASREPSTLTVSPAMCPRRSSTASRPSRSRTRTSSVTDVRERAVASGTSAARSGIRRLSSPVGVSYGPPSAAPRRLVRSAAGRPGRRRGSSPLVTGERLPSTSAFGRRPRLRCTGVGRGRRPASTRSEDPQAAGGSRSRRSPGGRPAQQDCHAEVGHFRAPSVRGHAARVAMSVAKAMTLSS